MPRGTQFSHRQLAARRLFLDGQGNLTRDAKVVLAAMKAKGHIAPSVLIKDATGAVDVNGTIAAAARREVWDYLKQLLNLDDYQEANIRDEDYR